MIIELLLMPIWSLFDLFIGLLPAMYVLPDWIISCVGLISKALFFFPVDVWLVCFGNIVFWVIALNGWAAIEWLYKKIPGVD